MDKKEFSPIEIDAIGEISNICLGNSASTLNTVSYTHLTLPTT